MSFFNAGALYIMLYTLWRPENWKVNNFIVVISDLDIHRPTANNIHDDETENGCLQFAARQNIVSENISDT